MGKNFTNFCPMLIITCVEPMVIFTTWTKIYSTNISVMQGLLDLEKFVSPVKILQLYGNCVLFLSLIIILMEPKLLLCCTNF